MTYSEYPQNSLFLYFFFFFLKLRTNMGKMYISNKRVNLDDSSDENLNCTKA